ncbi:hypothetical protein WICMUC_004675 [Wickerhamomyces mucosus]|uniref:Nuclear condensin complex subunit 3 C-terminal domain-containing protein n=1 Tax=Wickerhamomyces mucosus TaxID=1378264 RepID=A0A9P8PFM5_9ASCO|nr:hypothetical protein WICMUC_004675 [Wickerhamomyces mucosus]
MSFAVQRERIKFTERLSSPEQIQNALAKVFQDSQASVAGHKKQIIVLKAIQLRAQELDHEEFFNFVFCKLVNKVLVIKKSEVVGDRIVKLVAAFILSLQQDYSTEEEGEEEEEEDTLFSRFVRVFLIHLLKGIESKDKNVRYRVVQFLDFAMSGLGEIDQELYETLTYSLDRRLHDKEQNIRIKALHCIARFQEEQNDEADEDASLDDDATSKLLVAIQNDSSAEVRRAALLNLARSNHTKHYLLERAKDVNSINRRLVYSRVVKDLGDFRTIDSKTREKILSWGLKDREESVQKACVKMFAQDWLSTVDGDLIELLERLHIAHSEVAELAMKHFFNFRKDLIPKISFPEDIWLKLTPEISFLARTFYFHCFQNLLYDIVDANFPESARLAELLTRYLVERKTILNSEEEEDFGFVIENLLTIAVNYDYSDEIGRRAMLQTIRSSLTNDRLPANLTKVALQVLRKLSINERDFTSMVTEIISDIRDVDEENENNLPNSEEDELKTVLICLSICKSMLVLINDPLKDNISVTSLIDTLINPAVRNKNSDAREAGTEALSLCCLLDLELATEQLYLFGLCLSKGHEELRIIAIKAIFDILSVHGTKVLDVEDGVDTLSFHKLLYRTLKNPELPALQALCAEGLCKLYLADVMTDDELFETLILTYYNPLNADNQSLLQAFTFCLPVYCFSHPNHQAKMSSIGSDAFKRLYNAHSGEQEEDEREMISPTIILQQLIYWTDPANVVNQEQSEIQKSKTHLTLLIGLLESIEETDDKKYRKMIIMNMNKFTIHSSIGYEDLKKLKAALEGVEEIVEDQDNISKTNFTKFLNRFEPVFTEAQVVEQEKSNEDDLEYSVILEHPDEDKEENDDEIDEEYEEEQSRIVSESQPLQGLGEIPDLNVDKDISDNSGLDKDGDFTIE